MDDLKRAQLTEKADQAELKTKINVLYINLEMNE